MFDLKSRILIVDDMMTMRKVVAKCCKEIGFSDLTEAKDGVEAWEKITNANPSFDLVISDWNMPNCSGIVLLKRVRANSLFAKLPFVMLTAESEKHQVEEALKAGVSNYIIKPFTTAQLTEKLEVVHKRIVGK